jgi:hypothetical protein
LHRLLGDEGGLDGVGLLGGPEALEGGDPLARHGADRQLAGPRRDAVHMHRAGAALAEAAAVMRAGQAEVVPQRIKQRHLGVVHGDADGAAVDGHGQCLAHSLPPSGLHSGA